MGRSLEAHPDDNRRAVKIGHFHVCKTTKTNARLLFDVWYAPLRWRCHYEKQLPHESHSGLSTATSTCHEPCLPVGRCWVPMMHVGGKPCSDREEWRVLHGERRVEADSSVMWGTEDTDGFADLKLIFFFEKEVKLWAAPVYITNLVIFFNLNLNQCEVISFLCNLYMSNLH
jgi:hypothetical protein